MLIFMRKNNINHKKPAVQINDAGFNFKFTTNVTMAIILFYVKAPGISVPMPGGFCVSLRTILGHI